MIRLTGKSDNRNSDKRRSTVFVKIINSLVWQKSAVGTQTLQDQGVITTVLSTDEYSPLGRDAV
jgi:hypothetical protein